MTPNEIQNKKFDKGVGGFKQEEVNAYLGQLADYVQQLLDERSELEEKMLVLAEKVEEYREDEDSLRSALIGAQKLGDSVVRDAKKKAEIMLAEAVSKADELVADAKSSIDKEAVALTRMQGEVAEFKDQILGMYRRQVEMIQAIPYDKVPAPAPEAPVAAAQPPAQQQTPPPTAVESTQKIGEFVLRYEEEPTPPAPPLSVVPPAPQGASPADKKAGGKHKRTSHYGNLRFGEEYNLTRKD